MNDYFLNYVTNPEFNPRDFSQVGLDATNTSIKPKSIYEGLDSVQKIPLLQTNGKFDQDKFNIAYKNALDGYNDLTAQKYNQNAIDNITYFRDDIFAPVEKRRVGPDFVVSKVANPMKQTTGFRNFNVQEESKWSLREVAEANKVYDPITKKYLDVSPNDRGFFKNLFDPLVLATWDYDADENGNKTNDPSKVVYTKGSPKYDEEGNPYYEKLGGRSIYGKQVLSSWDTLTVDGSAWNKFDFFDADDKESSTTKTLVRDVIKVAPAFIPGINTWYIGARVVMNMGDLMAKASKIFTFDSDNATASKIEGMFQGLSFSTSDYSSEHTWSVENILNLGADVFTQLAEQRWIFKNIPKLYGKQDITNDLERQKFLQDARSTRYKELLADLEKNPSQYALRTTEDLIASAEHAAQRDLVNFSDKVSKLGEKLSKLYMTGVTVADSYGEAKQSGLSDFEAALFTLGYASGEYWLLNTGVGEQILPELRLEKARWRRAAQILTSEGRPEISAPKSEKLTWMQKFFNLGKMAATGDTSEASKSFGKRWANTLKDIFTGDLQEASTLGGSMFKTALAHSLGEGVEETSEELLLDLSKTLFNAAAWVAGSDSRMTPWENIGDRYGMSFVGGLIGGGLGTGLSVDTFKQFQNIQNMDKTQAFQELVHLVKEGEGENFLKTVNRLTLGNKYLKFSGDGEVVVDKNGNVEYAYQQGDSQDNMDLTYKKQLTNYVQAINDILTTEGARISDDSLISRFLGDLKMSKLANSNLAGSYLQEFNSVISKIVNLSIQLRNLKEGGSDSQDSKKKEENAEQISKLEAELKEARELKESFLDGTKGAAFVRQALFEMLDRISEPWIDTNFISYAEKAEKKSIKDIPEARLKQLKEKWDIIVGGSQVDKIRQIADIFELNNRNISQPIKDFIKQYFEEETLLSKIAKKYNSKLMNLNFQAAQGKITNEEFLKNSKEFIKGDEWLFAEALAEFTGTENIVDNIKNQILSADDLKSEDMQFTPEQLQDLINTIQFHTGTQITDPFTEITDELLQKTQKGRLEQFIGNTIVNNQNKLLEDFKNSQFISPEVHDFIRNLLNKFNFDEVLKGQLSAIMKDLKYIPIQELLDFYSVGLGGQKISEILEYLRNQIKFLNKSGNLQEFGYDGKVEEQIKYAHQVIQMLGSHILAARTDEISLGNLWGYNATVNKLDKEANLAELTKEQANTILYNLNNFDRELTFYENLFKVNSGQKLSEQAKINTKTHVLFVKTLTNITDTAPDDLDEMKALKKVLDSSILTKSLIDSEEPDYYLSEEDQIKLEKERQNIESALHNLLNVKDFDLGIFINSQNFKFIQANNQILNLETENVSPQNFIAWLAFTAAVEPKAFYRDYIDSIAEDFAAIPGQEFALKTSLAFLLNPDKFYKFGDKYNEVVENEIVNQEDDDVDNNSAVGFDNLKQFPKDSDSYLKYLHTFLIEGIAGSGKSTAMFSLILRIIRNSEFKDKLLSNVWIVHGVEDPGVIDTNSEEYKNGIAAGFSESDLYNGWRAYLLGLKLGFTPEELVGKCFNRASYLKKISVGYNNWKTDKQGNILYDGIKLRTNSDTLTTVYDVELNKSIESPSMILMDEVTRFSPQDQELSERFQIERNIAAVAAGDFSQLCAQGILKTGDDAEILRNHRNNFFCSPKLGTALRPNNNLQDQATKIIRESLVNPDITSQYNAFFEAAKDFYASNDAEGLNEVESIKVPYYEEEGKGLYGLKIESNDVVYYEGELSDEEKANYVSESLQKSITNLLRTLKPGEQLHYIWDGIEDSSVNNGALRKFLRNLNEAGEFKGKIDFTKNGASQGQEGQYYIVDLTLPAKNDIYAGEQRLENEAKLDYLKYIYTAASRATQGTLIVTDLSLFESEQADLIESNLSTESIKAFNEQRKKVLNESLGDFNGHLQLVNPIKTQVSTDQPATDVVESQTDTQAGSENGDGQNEDFANDNNIPFLNPIENKDDKHYNMLLHSMPANESGLREVEVEIEGKIVRKLKRTEADYKKGAKNLGTRIDNIHGLVQGTMDQNGNIVEKSILSGFVTNPSDLPAFTSDDTLDDQDKAIKLLETIRNLGLTEEDKSQLINKLNYALGIKSGVTIGVDYMFKCSTQYPENEKKGKETKHKSRKFFRYIQEKVLNIFSSKPKQLEPKNKTIDMVIYAIGKDGNRVNMLDIPLVVFTSPYTMLNTSDFAQLKSDFNSIYNKDLKKMFIGLQNKANKTPQEMLMLQHIQLFYLNEDFVHYFDWGNDTLVSRAQQSTGIFTSFHQRGIVGVTYQEEGFEYGGKWMTLDEIKQIPGNIVSNQVYVNTKQDVYFGEPYGKKSAILKGHPFILVSKDSSYEAYSDKDKMMLNDYLEWIKDPNKKPKVSRIYVSSPKSNVGQYIRNLSYVYEKGKTSDSQFGNMIASFRILQLIAKDNSNFDKSLEKYFLDQRTTPDAASLGEAAFRPTWNGIKKGISEINKYIEENLKETGVKERNIEEYEVIRKLLQTSMETLAQKNPNIFKAIIPENANIHKYEKSKVTLKNYLQQKLVTFVMLDSEIETLEDGKEAKAFIKAHSDVFEDDEAKVKDKYTYVKAKIEAMKADLDGWKTSEDTEPGIYYNLKLNEAGKISDEYVPVNLSLVSYYGAPIRVNGKLDSPSFTFDVLPLIQEILTTYSTKDDTTEYNDSFWKNIKPSGTNMKPNRFNKHNTRFLLGVKMPVIPEINPIVDQNIKDIEGKLDSTVLSFLNNSSQDLNTLKLEALNKKILLAVDNGKVVKYRKLSSNETYDSEQNGNYVIKDNTGTYFYSVKDLSETNYIPNETEKSKDFEKLMEKVENLSIRKGDSKIEFTENNLNTLIQQSNTFEDFISNILDQNDSSISDEDSIKALKEYYDEQKSAEKDSLSLFPIPLKIGSVEQECSESDVLQTLVNYYENNVDEESLEEYKQNQNDPNLDKLFERYSTQMALREENKENFRPYFDKVIPKIFDESVDINDTYCNT